MSVLQYPHPALRQKSLPVEENDPLLMPLVSRLRDLQGVHRALGMAAPQTGTLKRVFVIENGVYVNPEIVESSGGGRYKEGCISIRGVFAYVRRPTTVRARWTDEDWRPREATLDGMLARVFQHELDHLDGRLFIDHLGSVAWVQLVRQHPHLPAWKLR